MAAEPIGPFVPGEHHIELASGRYLDLARPRWTDMTLEDIAHGLSHTARFAGQSRRFYSVAEHACLVAAKLSEEGWPPLVQMRGLHHDDPEAFIGDVTRPLKSLLPGYRRLETFLWDEIVRLLEDFDLNNADPAVKAADDWALSCEAYHLLPSGGATWFCAGRYDPAVAYDLEFPYDTLGQEPERARALWLRWHERLAAEVLGA